MLILTAENAVKMFDDMGRPTESSDNFLIDIQEERTRKVVYPARDDFEDACEYANAFFGIDFSTDEITKILALYPSERTELALHSLNNTNAIYSFVNAISHFLVGSRWLCHGDKGVDLAEFKSLLTHQAVRLGYNLTNRSN